MSELCAWGNFFRRKDTYSLRALIERNHQTCIPPNSSHTMLRTSHCSFTALLSLCLCHAGCMTPRLMLLWGTLQTLRLTCSQGHIADPETYAFLGAHCRHWIDWLRKRSPWLCMNSFPSIMYQLAVDKKDHHLSLQQVLHSWLSSQATVTVHSLPVKWMQKVCRKKNTLPFCIDTLCIGIPIVFVTTVLHSRLLLQIYKLQKW